MHPSNIGKFIFGKKTDVLVLSG